MHRSRHRGGAVPAAALLRLARMTSGLSQQQLAARAGVPRSMISAYERDRRQPTLATLLRLLRAAGLELRLHLEPIVWADRGGDRAERPEAEDADADRLGRWRNAGPGDGQG
ncbi:MAG: helix-turn-helix domain-containing protein [Acidimicrobiales bacterium]